MSQIHKNMILTYLKKNSPIISFFWLIFYLFFCVSAAEAQGTLSLTVSPTLFDMSAEPGKTWSSSVRVINTNPYELKVYAEVVNFSPQGESGQGRFVPIQSEETQGQTLAEWFTIETPEIIIPPEQTASVPFTISVPKNAMPGGHFAAVLIGTKPPENSTGQAQVETSQIVTSLVFLRVAGDVHESGQIRSFRTTQRILEEPKATFELRFENNGNVHLQPQGEITILNMWGEERGVIPVNQGSMFGNVLPESIRKYSFTWTGEWSFADIGRYTAAATLAYGQDGRKFTSSKISFWVVPWKIVLSITLAVFFFLWIFVWAIKAYIKRMLSLAGVAPGSQYEHMPVRRPKQSLSMTAPLEAGMLDLRARFSESTSLLERVSKLFGFIVSYRYFFLVLTAIGLFIWLLIWYASSASEENRPYEVQLEGSTGLGASITSEEIEYVSLRSQQEQKNKAVASDDFPQTQLINQSGISGLAAKLRIQLEAEGFPVTGLSSEMGASENNTVIVYAPEYAEEAMILSKHIDGALLSVFPEASGSEYPITVYVGRDSENVVQ